MNIEPVMLDSSEVRKLLGAASGDGALLYIYLKSGNPAADAAQALNLLCLPRSTRSFWGMTSVFLPCITL